MIVSLIVAMDKNWGIGTNNKIPWRLASDLVRFKRLTMGHHLIMGRKTYESISHPLLGRKMVVISRNSKYQLLEGTLVPSLEDALTNVKLAGETEAFIIGGGKIFSKAIKYADRIYLTEVQTVTDADVFFPKFDKGKWIEVSFEVFEKNGIDQYPYTYRILHKRT